MQKWTEDVVDRHVLRHPATLGAVRRTPNITDDLKDIQQVLVSSPDSFRIEV